MTRNALIVGVVLGMSAASWADIINVPGDFPNVQAAIDSATDADEIVVAPGTWNGSLDLMGKAITVRSSSGPELTTLTTTDSLRVIYCDDGETTETVIEGFTITGDPGGGMFVQVSSPTLHNCIFDSCWAGSGTVAAAVDVTGGGPQFESCTFRNNGSNHGDLRRIIRLAASTAQFTDCAFESNQIYTYDSNGAVVFATASSPLFQGCTFVQNHNHNSAAASPQDLIRLTNFTVATIDTCVFADNEVRHVQVDTNSDLTVLGCNFMNNGENHDNPADEAAHQPILSVDGSSWLQIQACVFEGNRNATNSNYYSPIVVASTAELFSIQSCHFEGNESASLIYIDGDPENLGPHISDCTFTLNASRAIYTSGQIAIEACTFDQNDSGSNDGAAIYCADMVEVSNCEFTGNNAFSGRGGAIYSTSQLTLRNCLFDNNQSNDNNGGAIWCNNQLMMADCTLDDNFGILGSAIYLSSSAANSSYIANTHVTNNFAGVSGGIYCDGASPTIVNCLVADNFAASWGGALFAFANADPLVVNSTITGNTSLGGAAMYAFDVAAQPTMKNCIVWNNTNNGDFDDIDGPGVTTVTYSDIQGGYSGTGNIDADPQFVAPDLGNYHLTLESLCVDSGLNSALGADTADLDGDGNTTEQLPLDLDLNPRIVNDTVDMGCFEFDPTEATCLADFDGDSEVGFADLLALLFSWGPCADCPADIDGSGEVDFQDLLALLFAWGPC